LGRAEDAARVGRFEFQVRLDLAGGERARLGQQVPQFDQLGQRGATERRGAGGRIAGDVGHERTGLADPAGVPGDPVEFQSEFVGDLPVRGAGGEQSADGGPFGVGERGGNGD